MIFMNRRFTTGLIIALILVLVIGFEGAVRIVWASDERANAALAQLVLPTLPAPDLDVRAHDVAETAELCPSGCSPALVGDGA